MSSETMVKIRFDGSLYSVAQFLQGHSYFMSGTKLGIIQKENVAPEYSSAVMYRTKILWFNPGEYIIKNNGKIFK